VLLLIPRFGFFSYIAILYVSAMLNATLSIRRLLMVSRTSIDVPAWIIGPLLAAAIASSLVVLAFRLLPIAQPSAAMLAIKIILLAAAYIGLLFLTRSLNAADVRWFKAMVKSARNAKQ